MKRRVADKVTFATFTGHRRHRRGTVLEAHRINGRILRRLIERNQWIKNPYFSGAR